MLSDQDHGVSQVRHLEHLHPEAADQTERVIVDHLWNLLGHVYADGPTPVTRPTTAGRWVCDLARPLPGFVPRFITRSAQPWRDCDPFGPGQGVTHHVPLPL